MILIFYRVISLTQIISVEKPHQYSCIYEKFIQLSVWKYLALLSPYFYIFSFSH